MHGLQTGLVEVLVAPLSLRWRRVFRICTARPRPIHRASVIIIESRLVFPIDTLCRVPFRAVLDRLARQFHEDRPVLPTDSTCPMGRNQHFLSQPPVAGVDHQKSHFPGLVVDYEVFNMADLSVATVDVVPADLLCATQVDIPGGVLGRWGRNLGCHASKLGELPTPQIPGYPQ